MKKLYEKKLPTLKIVGWTLRSERGMTLIVVLMLMVIILAITGAGLLFSGIDLRVSGNYRVGTQAFYAADTGASDGYARIVQDTTASSALIPLTPLGGGLAFCSGTIVSSANCATPQPLPWTFNIIPGTALPGGHGVTPSFITFQYQIDATGIGPLNSARQVQALARYGPVQMATK